ncbi:ABC transporter permease [Cutibacterium equinum]|uniref:Transport permease protein n=1 Tax=Cutibacterium equinum TaxID=3016342 RepID=A0ABY7R0M8_9ACTN|nr:ABC transporter permease [Cutibacterium equinum]WCC80307.1 ABC transporter permease [Cutibacterium equinum]
MTTTHQEPLLVNRGTPITPNEMARRTQRWGFWPVCRWYFAQAKSYVWSIIVSAIGTPLLYLFAMGLGLGSLVDANHKTVGGVPYLHFVTPALMVTTVAIGVLSELTYPIMDGFTWQRLYHGPVATPVTPGQVALGQHIGVMIRMLLQSLFFWAAGLAFGAFPHTARSLVGVPITVLTASALGAPLQAFSATRDDEGASFSLVERFVVLPMTLFAGTYFPLDVLPMSLRWIGWISPIWHGTELARDVSYTHGEPIWLVCVHVVFLAILSVGGLMASRRIYTRRLVG